MNGLSDTAAGGLAGVRYPECISNYYYCMEREKMCDAFFYYSNSNYKKL